MGEAKGESCGGVEGEDEDEGDGEDWDEGEGEGEGEIQGQGQGQGQDQVQVYMARICMRASTTLRNSAAALPSASIVSCVVSGPTNAVESCFAPTGCPNPTAMSRSITMIDSSNARTIFSGLMSPCIRPELYAGARRHGGQEAVLRAEVSRLGCVPEEGWAVGGGGRGVMVPRPTDSMEVTNGERK